MRYRPAHVLALVLLAAALLVQPPAYAAESLQIAVRPGFGGAAKLGTWVPVEVELQNAGPEVVGDLQVQVEGQTSRGAWNRPPVNYSAPITLPSRSRKRVSLDVYLPTIDDKLQVQLISNGQIVARQPITLDRVGASEMFCGVLVGNRGGLDFLTTLDMAGPQRRVRLAQLETADIPAAPHLLQSLDCLILANVSTAGLAERQKSAIEHWVTLTGGLLVVGGGAGVQKTLGPLPKGLLPVALSGAGATVPVHSLGQLAEFVGQPLPDRGPWLAGDVTPTDGVTVVQQDGVPLLVAGRRGLGAVVYLGLDPTTAPLRGWEGGDLLWRYLLSQAPAPQPAFNNVARPFNGWGRLPRLALGDLTGSSRVSATWLLYLLLGYTLAVGPLNYVVLRRLGRLEWSLVSIPLLTLAAGGFALAGARSNPASDLVVNSLGILRSWDGQSALARSYVGIFSLREQAPDLQLPEGSLVQPQFYPFPFETPTPNQPPEWALLIRQGEHHDVARFALRPGALGTFAVDHVYRLPGRVTGELVVDGSSARGTVVSRLSRSLRTAAVVVGGDVVRLGDLRPGESRPIAVELRTPAVDLASIAKQLYPTEAETAPPEEAALRDLLLSAINPSFGAGSRVELGPAALVGWLDDAPLGQPVASNRATPIQRTLFVGALALRPAPGASLQVPAGLVSRRPLLATGGARLQGTSIAFNNGEAVSWEYQLPFDGSQLAVEELRLDLAGSLNLPGNPTATSLAGLGTAYLYDWQAAEWSQVSLDFGENRLPNPHRYVSPLGVVRLRYSFRAAVTAGTSAGATFSAFDLVVRGSAG